MDEKEVPSMRNPIARALRSMHLQPKIVKPKKGKGSYSRTTNVKPEPS